MEAPNILIVEDETAIAAFYRRALENTGYSAHAVQNGEDALDVLRRSAPALVLLDIELEGALDGFQTLARIREESNVPVMVITGHARSTFDLVRGLDLGADNYLVKPVGQTELLARVRAELRRSNRRAPDAGGSHSEVYRYGKTAIKLGDNQGVIERCERRIALGETELRVLKRLFETPGQTVGLKELLRIGWGVGYAMPSENEKKMVSACLYRLRRKITLGGLRREVIRNVKPEGYYIVPPD